jgi:isocitrate lyase
MTQLRHPKEHSWHSPRWRGITRPYTHSDVERLRGTVHIEYSLARSGAEKFWKLLRSESFIPTLGAVTGQQAVEMAQAGLKAIHFSGCLVSSDDALGGPMYPDPTLHHIIGAAAAVRSINHALLRADQVSHGEKRAKVDWMLPIVADAESESGGHMNAFNMTKALIEAGAAAIHFDDQLPTARKRGQVSGMVLVPTEEAIQKLVAARLASDAMGVPAVLIARTDARSAGFISSDYDARDRRFLTGERTPDGFHVYRGGLQAAITRGLSLAPSADLLWCETSEPNLDEARQFANAIHARFPGKMLAYNCSPSIQWRAKLNEDDIACFQRDLAAMGYRFQFVPRAGFHALNLSMYHLAKDYLHSGMTAYSRLQQRELEMAEELGYSTVKPRRSAGNGHVPTITGAITGGQTVHNAPASPAEQQPFELDDVDYNDGEATERTPMPHLYPLLESMPLPSTAAND